jgi:hypothetical protein
VAFHLLRNKHDIIPVMPEQWGTGKGQCIHAITGTGGLRDIAILVLDIGIRWGGEGGHTTHSQFTSRKETRYAL